MKRVWLGVSLSVTALMGIAGERVEQSVEVTQPGRIIIEHQSGQARIVGWDKTQVKVVGELDERAEGLDVVAKDNEVRIHVKMPRQHSGNWNWGREQGDNLEIFVPRQSFVEYQSLNAEVEVQDVTAGADLSTVNGDIQITAVSGRVRADAVNGDIRSQDLEGDIRLETVNGDIRDEQSRGEEIHYQSVNGNIHVRSSIEKIEVENVNGDIDLKLARVERLSLQTVSGDAKVSMQLSDNGEVEVNSVSADVALLFQDDVAASFELQSHAGGAFRNKLSADTARKAKYGPARWLQFSTGTGTARVEASTVSGRITLDKR